MINKSAQRMHACYWNGFDIFYDPTHNLVFMYESQIQIAVCEYDAFELHCLNNNTTCELLIAAIE